MSRIWLLAAAFLLPTFPAAGQQPRSSSWTSEKMRVTPRPRPVYPGVSSDELRGNCAGLTVTIRTRIERLKALQDQAAGMQWPPPSAMERWTRRPLDGDIARQRALVSRLNRALGAKGCETVDIAAELQRAPSAKARAR